MLRRLSLSSLCIVLAFAAGCRRGGDAPKNDGKEVRVAFVSNNPENFWKLAEVGCRRAEKDVPGLRVEFRMPKGTLDDQKKIIDDLRTKGIQGIAVSPNDAKNAGAYLKQINEKIPIVCQDNDVPDVAARRLYLGTHNYRAGRAAGELVKEALPQGGKVAIFVGDMAAQNAQERRQGVLDVLAGVKLDEMKDMTPAGATQEPLGDGKYILAATKTDGPNEEKAQRIAEDLLTREPDIACVVGLWAYNPPALLRAKDKTKAKAIIVGFDEDLTTLRAIEDGKIFGTVVQDPINFGYLSSRILHGIVKGDDSFLKSQNVQEGNRIYIPHRVFKGTDDAEIKKVKEFHKETRAAYESK